MFEGHLCIFPAIPKFDSLPLSAHQFGQIPLNLGNTGKLVNFKLDGKHKTIIFLNVPYLLSFISL
jgi:hypothetical protein